MTDEYTLQSLLPTTSYLLAYALPLLLVSLIPTFAGAFLTLARTRSFPPHYDPIPGSFAKKSRKPAWILEGGIGGLALGYAFGVHISTFLSLLIPSVTSSARLGKGSFLAIWLLSAIVTTVLAGRWRYCAFAFIGISGGVTLALGLSIIIHPSLLTRQVLAGLLAPLMLIAAVLPFQRYRLLAIRISAAAIGAFGLTISTALLGHVPGWANAWERFWQPHNIRWGSSQEQGLSAMFCLCTILGSAVDWFLRRRFGECPDEKWDSYLADYASNLPNRADRAGNFQPLASFWDRLFHPSKHVASRDIIFPPTGTPDLKTPRTLEHSLPTLHKQEAVSLPDNPGFLRKFRSQPHTRFSTRNIGSKKRHAIKFKPMGELSSDSEDDGDDYYKWSPGRPWLNQKSSVASTDATLIDDSVASRKGAKSLSEAVDVKDLDYDLELAKLHALGKARDLHQGSIPDYSDHEDDGDLGLRGRAIASQRSPSPKRESKPSSNSIGASSATSHTAVAPLSPTPSAHPYVHPLSLSRSSAPGNVPLAPVPATPSLIKALDRVAAAQKQAYGASIPAHTPLASPPFSAPLRTDSDGNEKPDGLPRRAHDDSAPVVIDATSQAAQSSRWQNFWRAVDEKAQE